MKISVQRIMYYFVFCPSVLKVVARFCMSVVSFMQLDCPSIAFLITPEQDKQDKQHMIITLPFTAVRQVHNHIISRDVEKKCLTMLDNA